MVVQQKKIKLDEKLYIAKERQEKEKASDGKGSIEESIVEVKGSQVRVSFRPGERRKLPRNTEKRKPRWNPMKTKRYKIV